MVVLKTASGFLHPGVERLFACMPEWGMAKIMRERDALSEVFIEAQGTCNVPADLCNFHGVCEACAVVVPLAGDEHLCFPLQTPERLRMDDPVSVPLEGEPRVIFRLVECAHKGTCNGHCVWGKQSRSLLQSLGECSHGDLSVPHGEVRYDNVIELMEL